MKLKRNTANAKNTRFQTGCVSQKRATMQTHITIIIHDVRDVSVIVG